MPAQPVPKLATETSNVFLVKFLISFCSSTLCDCNASNFVLIDAKLTEIFEFYYASTASVPKLANSASISNKFHNLFYFNVQYIYRIPAVF